MNRTFNPRFAWALLICAFSVALPRKTVADAPPPVESQNVASFAGEWEATYGTLKLKQTGNIVEGEYDSPHGTVKGTVEGRKLTFKYAEAVASGEGWFELALDGKSFTGKWRPAGKAAWFDWAGKLAGAPAPPAKPSFAGLWEASYGRMRLHADGDGKIGGVYSFAGGSSIDGTVKDDILTFTYDQPDGEKGTGTFKLAADGKTFEGDWQRNNGGAGNGGKWTGTRVEPQVGKVWLVVLEAPWEQNLSEHEYSYGLMLRTFFARVPKVEVRQRTINSEADFRRYCAETTYLAEPVVLYISSHGSQDGITVGGKTLGVDVLADCLKYHADLQLLHFGSCLVAGGDLPKKLQEKLGSAATFPISGFKLPADWMGSAVIDFTYLDLIFSHGLPPAGAAEQTRKMMSFANDQANPGDAVAPAGLVVFDAVTGK
jgi:hypothetical protein